ncbi:MAG: rRNA maturation RNase YbeY [Oscillospiraceae bacterium]|nr:rRNA maturation RNase YbeY [Oscillospiraceae bacterium]
MRRLRVAFNNEQKYIPITKEFRKLLRACCKCSLYCAEFDENCEISISFVTNDVIRELNAQYRNIDAPTDVLSFPLADNCEFDLNPDSDCYMLGDIIISTEKAAEQAVENNNSTEREIAFLVVHSMLHLLGYDHPDEDGPETKEMRKKEKEIMHSLGYESGEILKHPVHSKDDIKLVEEESK